MVKKEKSKALPERQREILDFILSEIHRKGYPPSVREIGKAVGLSSSSTVHSHLNTLEKKGYLRRDPSKPRALEILSFRETEIGIPSTKIRSVPVVGKIAAGVPILAQENIEDVFPLPSELTDENTFVLKVEGNSMIEAGIFEGDYLVVRQQPTANNGDIVVAFVKSPFTGEEEATVKKFFKEKNYIRLQPENSSLKPIVSKEVTVVGKAIALLRKL